MTPTPAPESSRKSFFRAIERLQIQTVPVAKRMLRTPPSKLVRAIQVPSGFDVADRQAFTNPLNSFLALCAKPAV